MTDAPMPTTMPKSVTNVVIRTDALQTLKVQSVADARYQLVIDGVAYTGQKTIHGKAIRLDRKGNALVLLVDDQAVPALELSEFLTIKRVVEFITLRSPLKHHRFQSRPPRLMH